MKEYSLFDKKSLFKRPFFLLGILVIVVAIIVVKLLNPQQEVANFIELPPKLEIIGIQNVHELESLGELRQGTLLDIYPDGSLLAVAPFEAPAKIIDPLTGETVYTFSEYPRSLDFSPDGNIAAIGTQTRQGHVISLWEFSTNQKIATLIGHTELNSTVKFSPDGMWLASAGWDMTVRVWDVERKQIAAILRGHTDWISELAFTPDGNFLVSASDDGTIRIWESTNWKIAMTLSVQNAGVLDIAFNRQGNVLAAAYDDHTIRLWSPQDGENIGILKGHTREVWQLEFALDGQLLASSSFDHTLRLWNIVEIKPILEIPFQNILGLGDVKFSPDGRLLLLNKNISSIEFWGVQGNN
jgi:WD40 repeat protein